MRPEGGYDDEFCSFGYQLSKGFRERKIPADEDTRGTEGRLERFVRGVG